MIRRHIEKSIQTAMTDTPVVLLNGARQTGKTTLSQTIAAGTGADYLTLDDYATLALAAGDPVGFIRNLSGPVVIDEIQKAPELFPAIKLSVDKDRRPGRFLLTGSANVMTLPRLSESLAGRMEILPPQSYYVPYKDMHFVTFLSKLLFALTTCKNSVIYLMRSNCELKISTPLQQNHLTI